MMKYAIGDSILFNNKKYFIVKKAIYKELEYYFVFNYDVDKKYKILYEEDSIIHQIVKFDEYKFLFDLFK